MLCLHDFGDRNYLNRVTFRSGPEAFQALGTAVVESAADTVTQALTQLTGLPY